MLVSEIRVGHQIRIVGPLGIHMLLRACPSKYSQFGNAFLHFCLLACPSNCAQFEGVGVGQQSLDLVTVSCLKAVACTPTVPLLACIPPRSKHELRIGQRSHDGR